MQRFPKSPVGSPLDIETFPVPISNTVHSPARSTTGLACWHRHSSQIATPVGFASSETSDPTRTRSGAALPLSLIA